MIMNFYKFLLIVFLSTLPLCVIFLFLMQALLYKNYSRAEISGLKTELLEPFNNILRSFSLVHQVENLSLLIRRLPTIKTCSELDNENSLLETCERSLADM